MSGSLRKIEQMVCDELDEIAEKGVMNHDNLDAIDKLTHSLKSIEYVLSIDKKHGEGKEDATANEDKAEKEEALLKEFAKQLKSL